MSNLFRVINQILAQPYHHELILANNFILQFINSIILLMLSCGINKVPIPIIIQNTGFQSSSRMSEQGSS